MPAVALEVAPKITGVLAPAVTLKGLGGLEVIPAGRLFSVIWTVSVKPFSAVMETFMGELAPPSDTETEVEEKARVKSGEGGRRAMIV